MISIPFHEKLSIRVAIENYRQGSQIELNQKSFWSLKILVFAISTNILLVLLKDNWPFLNQSHQRYFRDTRNGYKGYDRWSPNQFSYFCSLPSIVNFHNWWKGYILINSVFPGQMFQSEIILSCLWGTPAFMDSTSPESYWYLIVFFEFRSKVPTWQIQWKLCKFWRSFEITFRYFLIALILLPNWRVLIT